jgi:hypothetical protein
MIVSSNNTRNVSSVARGTRVSTTGIEWIIVRVRDGVCSSSVGITYKIVTKSDLASYGRTEKSVS